jgi:hypothetical protein
VGDRVDLLAEDQSDPDSGADRAEPGADAEPDRPQAIVGDAFGGRASRQSQLT